MDEIALEPSIFFRTLRAREAMLLRGKATAAQALARFLHVDAAQQRDDLERLVMAGLALETPDGFVLTDEGEASVRWSAPPPPEGVMHHRWVGELARAIAEHYAVSMADLLRAEVGQGVLARSRICFALWSRGWAVERIEEHFGLPPGWARRAIERWKRMRDQLPPSTGAELRAWRERMGYTQAEAAVRLGVSRRTVLRAERRGSLSVRMAVSRV